MAKRILLFLCCAALIFSVSCRRSSETEVTSAANTTASNVNIDFETLKVKDFSYALKSFNLNGTKYTLPFPVSKLIKSGFAFEEGIGESQLGYNYYTCVKLSEKSGKSLQVYLYNSGFKSEKLSSLNVYGASVNSKDKPCNCVFGKNLKLGADIKAISDELGKPTKVSGSESVIETLAYTPEKASENTSIKFDFENNKCTEISLTSPFV